MDEFSDHTARAASIWSGPAAVRTLASGFMESANRTHAVAGGGGRSAVTA